MTAAAAAIGDAEDEYDEDEPPPNQHDAAGRRPLLPPTDRDMLTLVALLMQLESLELEPAESQFAAHTLADIGRCCPKLARLRVPAPLDFDMLSRTGPPLFLALVHLFPRRAATEYLFETR
jgi:hypothetical protein